MRNVGEVGTRRREVVRWRADDGSTALSLCTLVRTSSTTMPLEGGSLPGVTPLTYVTDVLSKIEHRTVTHGQLRGGFPKQLREEIAALLEAPRDLEHSPKVATGARSR